MLASTRRVTRVEVGLAVWWRFRRMLQAGLQDLVDAEATAHIGDWRL